MLIPKQPSGIPRVLAEHCPPFDEPHCIEEYPLFYFPDVTLIDADQPRLIAVGANDYMSAAPAAVPCPSPSLVVRVHMPVRR
jgi:hypothetical protein